MTQNYLVFPINHNVKFVEGSIPVGIVTANSINKNSVFAISPFKQDTVMQMVIQPKDRRIAPQTVFMTLTDKLSPQDLYVGNESFYELIKDWYVWEAKIPQVALTYISSARNTDIGFTFVVKQSSVRNMGAIPYGREVTQDNDIITIGTYGIVKVPILEYQGVTYNYNDAIYRQDSTTFVRYPAIVFADNTSTAFYSIDPAIQNDNFEHIELSFTEQVIQSITELFGRITIVEDTKANRVELEALEVRVEDLELEKLDIVDYDADKLVIDNELIRLENDKADNTTVEALDTRVVGAENELVRLENDKADITYVDSEIANAVDSVYDYKGSVEFESLPTTNQKVGDVYNITNDFTLNGNDYLAGTDVAWNGTGWNALSSKTPLSNQIKRSSNVNETVEEALVDLENDKVDNTTYNADKLVIEQDIVDLQNDKIPKTDIVNDLTSGGTTKVLSAEQGKVLDSKKVNLFLDQPLSFFNGLSLREWFIANQLISNADFENGTAPWLSLQGTNNVTNGILYNTSNGSASFSLAYQSLTFNANQKYYSIFRTRVTNSNASSLRMYQSGTTLHTIGVDFPTINTWYTISGITIDTVVRSQIRLQQTYVDNETSNGKVMEVDFAYSFNADSLKTNQQFSPMFNTTFDLMTDAQIKQQLDYWVELYNFLKSYNEFEYAETKANKQLEAWLTPTLTSATSTYIRYRKDNFGTVVIEGNITVTTAGTNFTLPTGYRPLTTLVLGDFTFNTNGTVVSANTGLKYINVRFTGGA